MSISNRLDETLEKLDLTAAAAAARDTAISESLGKIRGKMSGLDIDINIEKPEVVSEAPKPRYGRTELADTARKVYRDNINPVDKEAVEKKAGKDMPSTIASRANVVALSRSLAGMRSSGNDGKTSFVGPNGSGNVGKLSPTGANDVGNVTNNVNNYYALTTDMTLEEYEKYVQTIFEGEDCECEHEKEEKKAKKEDKKEIKKEDVVYELEDRLVTLGSTDWIKVDQVLREMAKELDVAPRTLSRDFKSVHGLYPDKWIKEHLNVELCGYMPLEEAARLNKVGAVYEVTFMFRGGTNRLKFFWPSPGTPSKEDMQREVEKFWPKARLIAFYPTIDNEQQGNFMVMAPPMTENYYFQQPDEWSELSEEASDILKMIYEEEGEPASPVFLEEDGYVVTIEDHETGEERRVLFTEGGLHAWFSKSKSKDGKGGWVQSDGSTCARKPGQTSAPKCYSSQRLAALKRTPEGKKKIRSADARKKKQDAGQSSKSGAAKPTYVKTFTDPKDRKKYKSGDQTLKDESFDPTIDEACWKGYTQKGMKTMFGKQYPNCVKKTKTKKEEVEYVDENAYQPPPQIPQPRTGQQQRVAPQPETRKAPGLGGAVKRIAGKYNNMMSPYRDFADKHLQRDINAPMKYGADPDPMDKAMRHAGNFAAKYPDAIGGGIAAGIAGLAGAGAANKQLRKSKRGTEISNGINDMLKDIGRALNDDDEDDADSRYEKALKAKKRMDAKKMRREMKESMYGLGKLGGERAQEDNRYKQTKVRTAEYDKANKHANQQKSREASAYNKQMSKLNNEYLRDFSDELLNEGGAWTRKEGQNPEGGLNAKGRASAKKEGHNLKPPVTEKNPTGKKAARKKSFCSRMRGMRKRQKPSNNTGKDRLSLSLKKWNC